MIEYRPESRRESRPEPRPASRPSNHRPRDYRALRRFVLVVVVLSLGTWILKSLHPNVHMPSVGGIILMVATLYVLYRWLDQRR